MNKSNLIQQNHLLQQKKANLEETIKSLENENQMLHNILATNSIAIPHQEDYVSNIWRDEMRDGFLVTSHRKRLWNTQIGILKEFERICQKHNLKWFAYGNTLLGAVSHKGFVPWSFDISVAMLRPDYEKFRKVVEEEVNHPYLFEPWYNHRLKVDMISNIHDDENLPLIPFDLQMSYPTIWPFYPKLRIRDSRTTMILYNDWKNMPQNACIDIYPLDPVPPFEDERFNRVFESAKVIFLATIMPWRIKHFMNKGENLIFPREMLQNFLKLPFRKRAIVRETFMAENFFDSKYVTELRTYFFRNKNTDSNYLFSTKDFKEIIYSPFEKIQIPIPAGYEIVLNSTYKDWHEINKDKVCSLKLPYCSADIPYEEYAEKSMFLNKDNPTNNFLSDKGGSL